MCIRDRVNIIDSLRVTSKIIELDLDKCIELNETLPEAIVINGDGTCLLYTSHIT